MKKWSFLFLLLIAIVGCNEQDVVNFDSDSTLIVKERVGESDGYQVINEIKDKEKVQVIIDIFNNATWETDTQRDMPPPDYKLNNYDIWVTPSGNNLEIINRNNSYYVQLSDEDSEKLFKLMTGKELN